MTPADVDPAADAVARGGWGDRRAWFTFATAHPGCGPIVAVDRDGIVGTGVGTANGSVGWVGTIFVTPERRGAGLGRALTDHVCAALEAAGCRSLVLVATDEGRLLYERMGFEVVDRYATVEREGTGSMGDASAADGGADAPDASRILAPFTATDVPEAAALDRVATGEDRAHLLASFAALPGGLTVRAAADGSLRAFLLRAPWGGGATIAPDLEDARTILAARLRAAAPGHRVRAGVLASNEAGLAMLHGDGWTDAWTAPRMARGAPVDATLASIWGQFNHAVG